MTAGIVLGRAPVPLSVTVARQGDCSFALAFWADEDMTEPANLDGVTVRLTVDLPGTDAQWDATVADGVATWTLTDEDTDLAAGRYPARLLLIEGATSFVAASGGQPGASGGLVVTA